MFVFDLKRITNPRFIINFPTKRHWREKSILDDIRTGVLALAEEIRQRKIRSIAIPPLGCGLGGLLVRVTPPTQPNARANFSASLLLAVMVLYTWRISLG